MAVFGKEIFGRVFTHMDVAGLLGGRYYRHPRHTYSPDRTCSQRLALSSVSL
jgi:hypothetical protein